MERKRGREGGGRAVVLGDHVQFAEAGKEKDGMSGSAW